MHHQARLADERLRRVGLSRGFVIVPNSDHGRMVLGMSRADHTAGSEILRFLRETACGNQGGQPR